MPHIIVLGEDIELLTQMNVYSHDIEQNIENEEYHGQQLTDAQQLQAEVADLASQIDERFRSEIEAKISQQQSLLGI